MKHFDVHELQAGKYFSESAYIDKEYILLSPETPIDESLPKLLESWDILTIYSKGIIADNQATILDDDSVVRGVSNLNTRLKEKAELDRSVKRYGDLIAFVEDVFAKFTTNNSYQPNLIQEKIKDFVGFIKDNRSKILRYVEFTTEADYLVQHTAKSIIVSTIVGQELHQPPHKLIDIATAALFHEIGMLQLPKTLYMSDTLFSEKEKRIISTHPVLGFKLLRAREFPMHICLAVLESHENVDGSGYPQGLNAKRISEYAKILAVVSSYVAMTSHRPFRKPIDGHTAILELVKKRDTVYDSAILNSLLKSVSVYPVGTYVQVQNGAKGVVVESIPDKPRHPIVKLILGPRGEAFKESPIVNTDSESYTIAETISPERAQELFLTK